MTVLPEGFDILHIVAVAFLALSWVAYAPLLAAFARGTLNSQLDDVRKHWIGISIIRENRTFDAVLLGHIINSVAFFGSATLIVLAGLVGTLASVSKIHEIIVQLPLVAEMGVELFALKLLVIVFLMTVSFFSFTYSLRKLIYTIALVGGLPETADDRPGRDVMIDTAATVLTEAVRSFNSGIRGYYYAVSAMFLFIGPIPCIAATAIVMFMLFYRQTSTSTANAIERYVDALGSYRNHPK